MDIERSRTRRERTYINMECCVCEESLEYTLRGERILQLSCGHVSHEACFYEYIREFESQHCPTCNATLGLDTSRGVQMDLGTSASASEPCDAVLTHARRKTKQYCSFCPERLLGASKSQKRHKYANSLG
jgi:hypothetical protein